MMTGPQAIAALPSSIRVGPFDFKIVKWDMHAAIADNRYGEFSNVEEVIRIQSQIISPIQAMDTFIHEVTHAIWFVAGIEDGDKEERTVSVLGTMWTQIYRDNPWLARWLSDVFA